MYQGSVCVLFDKSVLSVFCKLAVMFDFWRVVRPAHCSYCQLMVVVVGMEVVGVELAVRRHHRQVNGAVREWTDEDVDGAPV